MTNKDEIAEKLIAWHFKIEPDLGVIYRIVSDNEDASDEPIKLLEVNAYHFVMAADGPEHLVRMKARLSTSDEAARIAVG